MSLKDLFDVSQEVVIITGSAGQLGIEYTKTFMIRSSIEGLRPRPNRKR